jgi:hypothetical protein
MYIGIFFCTRCLGVGANPIKLFTVFYFFIARVFVSGNPFRPSLMFVGEARSLPKNGADERCFTGVDYSLLLKILNLRL